MAAVVERAGRPAQAPASRPRARAGSARRRASRPRVANGVVWIVAATVLLGGVVAMNVAVLRLNLGLDDLARQRAKLRAENAALASQLSSAAGAERIESLARSRLGMVPASADGTTYVYLGR